MTMFINSFQVRSLSSRSLTSSSSLLYLPLLNWSFLPWIYSSIWLLINIFSSLLIQNQLFSSILSPSNLELLSVWFFTKFDYYVASLLSIISAESLGSRPVLGEKSEFGTGILFIFQINCELILVYDYLGPSFDWSCYVLFGL